MKRKSNETSVYREGSLVKDPNDLFMKVALELI